MVYADETSWSINSVWAFLSERARLTIFVCRKDGQTLAVLLKMDTFAGTRAPAVSLPMPKLRPLHAAHIGQLLPHVSTGREAHQDP